MPHLALATRYRPQTFAEVAGQPPAAIALSKAAAQDKVAPAYLLSGTRGVGKTTIARIFAKALNCERGPAAEPCNACSQCAHITAGNHIDVAEIDGASNTGVDDIRALRETVGFMPMEGRYKIFIIDEAHMLSKSAFNALLKTLEEPPAHTTFIFATTEAHRFPATIISRCQHFVFQHLPEQAIADHLVKILDREGIAYDANATRIIARRASGSVRDSLSLLDQAIAMGNATLDEATVRKTLGLAGPELFARLFDCIAAQDCAQLIELTSGLLANGIDLGFFLKELITDLRNLFLLRQTGEKILPALQLTEDEARMLREIAGRFQPAHLHAAWQLALESQRSITQSAMPGSALELLLINLALLPQLVPIGSPGLPAGASQASPPRSGDALVPPQSGSAPASPPTASAAPASPSTHPTWQGFREFCRTGPGKPGDAVLASLQASWHDDTLEINVPSESLWHRLQAEKKIFEDAIGRYCPNNTPRIVYQKLPAPAAPGQNGAGALHKPEIQLCCSILGAEVAEFSEKPGHGGHNAQHE